MDLQKVDSQHRERALMGVAEAEARFKATCDALRELAEHLGPAAHELDERGELPSRIERVLERVSDEDRRIKVRMLISSMLRGLMDKIRSEPSTDIERDIALRVFPVDEIPDTATELDVSASQLSTLLDSDDLFRDVIVGIFEGGFARRQVKRRELLMQSILAMTVSAFEVLVAAIVRAFIVSYPKSADSTKKEFSLEDVLKFESMTDALEDFVESRVDAVMRGSAEDWSEWLGRGDRLGLEFSSFCPDWESTWETFQRRHLVIHTGGVVSERYARRVTRPSAPVGHAVIVDDGYLKRAITHLECLGLGLAISARVQLGLNPEMAAVQANSYCYGFLLAERWDAASTMAEVGQRTSPSEMTRMMLQVNAWIAQKEIGNLETVLTEVDQWDVSALDDLFRMARLALLDDHDGALQMAETLCDAGTLGIMQVSEWPLLRRARTSDQFPAVFRRLSGGVHQSADESE